MNEPKAKWGRWIAGRQHTGYFKMLLAQSQRWKFDVHLLKFEKGAFIPFHTDPVANFRHFRLNVVLKKSSGGGLFLCDRPLWSVKNRVYLFRSDLSPHAVSKVQGGTRYVLSIGWLRSV